MRTCTFMVAVTLFSLFTAPVVRAGGFYGVIRFDNNFNPGYGVALSTSLVDFLNPAGPNGQGIVESAVSADWTPGPTIGSTVQLKDFAPGLFVSDLLMFSTMSPGPGFDGSMAPSGWWFIPFDTPFGNPSGCPMGSFPFCVLDSPMGGATAYFTLRGGTSRQAGWWAATFAAWFPTLSATDARAALNGGQTIVAPAWSAEALTMPEPRMWTTLIIPCCLLLLAHRRLSAAHGAAGESAGR